MRHDIGINSKWNLENPAWDTRAPYKVNESFTHPAHPQVPAAPPGAPRWGIMHLAAAAIMPTRPKSAGVASVNREYFRKKVTVLSFSVSMLGAGREFAYLLPPAGNFPSAGAQHDRPRTASGHHPASAGKS